VPIPLTGAELRWVPVGLTIVDAPLSLATWIDHRSRAESGASSRFR
jgi:hypothetical protein